QPHSPPGQARPVRQLVLRDRAGGGAVPALRALRARCAPPGSPRLYRAGLSRPPPAVLVGAGPASPSHRGARLRLSPRAHARDGAGGQGRPPRAAVDARPLVELADSLSPPAGPAR